MITRARLKADIDELDEQYLDVLHRILAAFKAAPTPNGSKANTATENPLRDSVTFENDILTPIDEPWDAE